MLFEISVEEDTVAGRVVLEEGAKRDWVWHIGNGFYRQELLEVMSVKLEAYDPHDFLSVFEGCPEVSHRFVPEKDVGDATLNLNIFAYLKDSFKSLKTLRFILHHAQILLWIHTSPCWIDSKYAFGPNINFSAVKYQPLLQNVLHFDNSRVKSGAQSTLSKRRRITTDITSFIERIHKVILPCYASQLIKCQTLSIFVAQ